MDALRYARERLARTPRQFGWPPPHGTDLGEWGSKARRQVISLIGAQDDPWPALDPQYEAAGEFMGSARTRVEFISREEFTVSGVLLVPKSPNGSGIVCVPGHGAGLAPNVGLMPEDYQHHFGPRLAELGATVLVIEPVSFGASRSEPAPETLEETTCHPDTTAALMLGETMLGWRVRDARAGLSLLASLPQVDTNRLGVCGISGGGTVSFFTSIVDERVKAAAISGYFCTFAASILGVHHCVDNYVPGLGLVAEMPDLVAAIAPRTLLTESGTEDPIFPLGAYRQACEKAREIYRAHGVPSCFQPFEFEGDHFFHGQELLPNLVGALS